MAEPPATPAAVVASWAIRPGCWGAADGERLLVAELWAPAWALLSSEAGRRGRAGSVASASTRHLDCTAKPTPVFLPGESHGQRSLVDYTVRGVAKSRT